MILAILITLGMVIVINVMLILLSPFIPPLSDFFDEFYRINNEDAKHKVD